MKKYFHLKEKAIKLRERGHSLNAIQERLQLSKTTIYYWVKNIKREQVIKRPVAKKNQKLGSIAVKKKYAKLREVAYNEAFNNAKKMMKIPTFRDFILLYMTEGFRRTRHVVSIANSNPSIIQLANIWINYLTPRKNHLKYNLQIHEDNDEKKIKQFWAKKLKIKSICIKIIRKSNSGKMIGRNWRSVNGVLTVGVNDTYLRSKIQAWMDFVENDWNATNFINLLSK